jgi:hypothetical protein
MRVRYPFAVFVLTAMAVVVAAPAATAQIATEDSVTGRVAGGFFDEIQIDVRSGPSGENPTGTAFITFGPTLGGTVTCLAVDGNTATLVVADEVAGAGLRFHGIQVVDNAGRGAADTFDVEPFRDPHDCSPISPTIYFTPVASGDIVVVDAPPLPTSKEQCKNGGWRNFGAAFKNEGQCVAFVQRRPKP